MNLSAELAFLIVMVDIQLVKGAKIHQNAGNVSEKNFGQSEEKTMVDPLSLEDLKTILREMQEENARLRKTTRHFVTKDGQHYLDFGIRAANIALRPCICSTTTLVRSGCLCDSRRCYHCKEIIRELK